MKIFVQGMWHCGCVISACLSSIKHEVTAYDDDKKTINNLKKKITPIYEPGLLELIKSSLQDKSLTFTNNLNKINSSDIVWFAYDTPVNEKDQANEIIVLDKIKKSLKKLKSGKLIIISSQIPVGSTKLLEDYSKFSLKKKFDFYYCPENLRLGNALQSFLSAERIVVGIRNNSSKNKIESFFSSINKNLIWMKTESAEVTKHAINSFLGTSISFINEISSICEKTGANSKEVEEGLKSEARIGRKAFLSPGSPFSGGTLGRDINYLSKVSKKHKLNTRLLSSIMQSNEKHKSWFYHHLKNIILNGNIKNVVIWGLTYTENTSTLRKSLSIEISKWLKYYNIKVFGYDKNVRKLSYPNNKLINLIKSPTSYLNKADILIILGKSNNFLGVSKLKIQKINKKLIIIDPNYFCNHFEKYYKNKYIHVGKYIKTSKKKNLRRLFNYNFKNQSVIVTGSSKGLGYEIARSFLKLGANLMICSRNSYQIKKAFTNLNKLRKKKQKIYYSVTDVSSPIQSSDLIKKTISRLGKVDILVNNAGIYGPKGHIEKVNWDEWKETIQINLYGSILMCKNILPHFKKRNTGKIIQISGGGATSPLPFISAYALSKAAIVRFVENLSNEIKKYNIQINAVAPGPLNTDMLKEILKAGPKKVGKAFYNKSLIQNEEGGTDFEKVCDLILFLASKHSNEISGKIISAVWDNWKNWINNKNDLKNSDVYTLRRIVGKDRGFEWGDN